MKSQRVPIFNSDGTVKETELKIMNFRPIGTNKDGETDFLNKQWEEVWWCCSICSLQTCICDVFVCKNVLHTLLHSLKVVISILWNSSRTCNATEWYSIIQQAIGCIILYLLGLCGTTYNNFRQKPLWEKLDNATTSSEVKFLFHPLFRLEWLFDKSKASHFNVEA